MSAPDRPPEGSVRAPLGGTRAAEGAPLGDAHPSTLHSLLMSSAVQRLVGALALIALLWLTVAWALVEPG